MIKVCFLEELSEYDNNAWHQRSDPLGMQFPTDEVIMRVSAFTPFDEIGRKCT